ncbi:MAG: hypothetical protein PHX40_02440 [Bacilli bacterium]|nr:hypothetical protein [Bacilli bacterium]
MKNSYKIAEKLYEIGLMGAVMGLEGSSIDYYGRSYKTKIGDYELKAYYFSYDRNDIKIPEVDIVCVDLLKEGKYIKNIFYSKSQLDTPKYLEALTNDDDLEINKKELREEFIKYMFSSDEKDIRSATSDKKFQELKIKSTKFNKDIALKYQEIQDEYALIKNGTVRVLSKKPTQQ